MLYISSFQQSSLFCWLADLLSTTINYSYYRISSGDRNEKKTNSALWIFRQVKVTFICLYLDRSQEACWKMPGWIFNLFTPHITIYLLPLMFMSFPFCFSSSFRSSSKLFIMSCLCSTYSIFIVLVSVL